MTARSLMGEFTRGITHADAKKEGLKLWRTPELQTVRSLLSRPTNIQHIYITNILYIVSSPMYFDGPAM